MAIARYTLAVERRTKEMQISYRRSGLEGSICDDDELIPVDYGRLTEKAEQAAKKMI